jgi:hypothetical protein
MQQFESSHSMSPSPVAACVCQAQNMAREIARTSTGGNLSDACSGSFTTARGVAKATKTTGTQTCKGTKTIGTQTNPGDWNESKEDLQRRLIFESSHEIAGKLQNIAMPDIFVVVSILVLSGMVKPSHWREKLEPPNRCESLVVQYTDIEKGLGQRIEYLTLDFCWKMDHHSFEEIEEPFEFSAELGRLDGLKTLIFRDSELMTLPRELGSLTFLEYLDIGTCSNPIPDVCLSNLKKWSLHDMSMNGASLAAWLTKNAPALQWLVGSPNYHVGGFRTILSTFLDHLGQVIGSGVQISCKRSLRGLKLIFPISTEDLIQLFTEVLHGFPSLEAIVLGKYNSRCLPDWKRIGNALENDRKDSTFQLTTLEAPGIAATFDGRRNPEERAGILQLLSSFSFLCNLGQNQIMDEEIKVKLKANSGNKYKHEVERTELVPNPIQLRARHIPHLLLSR